MAGTVEKSGTGLEESSNYYNQEGFEFGKSYSKINAYLANAIALGVLVRPEEQNRFPTYEEKHLLARYVGFGGLKEILLDPANNGEWETESDIRLRPSVKEIYRLFSLLDPDGSQRILHSAKRSILNAHFTAFPIIKGIYHAISTAGFKQGNVLEPAAGVGNFLAAMPSAMAERSQLTAIEMDRCTGKILQHLYPIAETHITALEKINLPENHFDLVISNVPFGDVPVFDSQLATTGIKLQ